MNIKFEYDEKNEVLEFSIFKNNYNLITISYVDEHGNDVDINPNITIIYTTIFEMIYKKFKPKKYKMSVEQKDIKKIHEESDIADIYPDKFEKGSIIRVNIDLKKISKNINYNIKKIYFSTKFNYTIRASVNDDIIGSVNKIIVSVLEHSKLKEKLINDITK